MWTKARVEAWRERGERSTVAVWTEHQLVEFLDVVASDPAGQAWNDTGYVFTTSDGQPLHPDYLTRRFRSLVEQSGLRSGYPTCGTERPASLTPPART